MRRNTIGIIGLVLVVVALIGAGITFALFPATFRASPPIQTPSGGTTRPVPPESALPSSGSFGGYSSLGQQIYFTGVGSSGPIPRTGGFGMMARGGCANCHGSDGRGGRIAAMMGSGIDVPDIRYSTLTTPHTENGTTVPAVSDAAIEAAVRTGADPHGGTLDQYMPRWQMNDTDMNALIAYLKELK